MLPGRGQGPIPLTSSPSGRTKGKRNQHPTLSPRRRMDLELAPDFLPSHRSPSLWLWQGASPPGFCSETPEVRTPQQSNRRRVICRESSEVELSRLFPKWYAHSLSTYLSIYPFIHSPTYLLPLRSKNKENTGMGICGGMTWGWAGGGGSCFNINCNPSTAALLTLSLGVHPTLFLKMPLGFVRKTKQNTYYKICTIPSNLSFWVTTIRPKLITPTPTHAF